MGGVGDGSGAQGRAPRPPWGRATPPCRVEPRRAAWGPGPGEPHLCHRRRARPRVRGEPAGETPPPPPAAARRPRPVETLRFSRWREDGEPARKRGGRTGGFPSPQEVGVRSGQAAGGRSCRGTPRPGAGEPGRESRGAGSRCAAKGGRVRVPSSVLGARTLFAVVPLALRGCQVLRVHQIPHQRVPGGCVRSGKNLHSPSEMLPCPRAGRSLPGDVTSVRSHCGTNYTGVGCHHGDCQVG